MILGFQFRSPLPRVILLRFLIRMLWPAALLGATLTRAWAAPDLVADNLALTSSTTDVSTPIYLNLDVRNIGADPAGVSWLYIYASVDSTIDGSDRDYLLAAWPVRALAANESETHNPSSLPLKIDPSDVTIGSDPTNPVKAHQQLPKTDPGKGYYIAAMVDKFNQVPGEASEANTFLAPQRLNITAIKPDVPKLFGPYPGMNYTWVKRLLEWFPTPHATRYDVYFAKVSDLAQQFTVHNLSPTTQTQPLRVFVATVMGGPATDVVSVSGNDKQWEIDLWANNQKAPGQFTKSILNDQNESSEALKLYNPSDVIAVNLRDPDVGAITTWTQVLAPHTRRDIVAVSHHNMIWDSAKNVEDTDAEYSPVVWYENASTSVTTRFIPHLIALDPKNPIKPYGLNAVVAADFDGDHDVDLFVGGEGRNSSDPQKMRYNAVFYENQMTPPPAPGDKKETFTLPRFIAKPAPSLFSDIHDMAVGDFDADGSPDIAVISLQHNAVGWLKNKNHGAFDGIVISEDISAPSSVCVCDVDQDGWPDIIVSSYLAGTVTLFHNEGAGRFSPYVLTDQILPDKRIPELQQVTTGDLNGDGWPDILVASALKDQVVWFANHCRAPSQGGPLISFTPQFNAAPNDRILSVGVGDFNQDLLPDIVTANLFSKMFLWLENKPAFTSKNLVATNLRQQGTNTNPATGTIFFDPHGDPPKDFDFHAVYAWQVVASALGEKTATPFSTFRAQETVVEFSLTLENPVTETDGLLSFLMSFKNVGPERVQYDLDLYPTQWVDYLAHPIFVPLLYGRNPLLFRAQKESPGIGDNDYNLFPGETENHAFKFDFRTHQFPFTEGEYYITGELTAGNYAAGVGGNPPYFPPQDGSGCNILGDMDGSWNGVTDGLNDPSEHWTREGMIHIRRPLINPVLGDNVHAVEFKVCDVPDLPSHPLPHDGSTTASTDAVLGWTSKHVDSYDVKLAQATSVFVSITSTTLTGKAAAVRSIAAADLNQDGKTDLISSYGNANGEIDYYLNNGAEPPQFKVFPVVTGLPIPNSITTADVDGDTFPDVIVTYGNYNQNQIAWYRNDGQMFPDFEPYPIASGATTINMITAGDLDGDGDPDLVSAGTTGDRLAWYENDGTGQFTEHVIDNGSGLAFYALIADVNGDNCPDILVSLWNSDAVVWYENSGTNPPVFIKHVVSTQPISPRGLAVADFNIDGHLDIACASEGDNTVAWYESDGASPVPSFTRHVLSSAAMGVRSLVATDFNHDGQIDLIAASPRNATVTWFRSGGGTPPTFSPTVLSSTFTQATSLLAADLSRSPNPEVLCTSPNNGLIAYYHYGQQFVFSSLPEPVASGLIDPTYTPAAPGLDPAMGYQWQVTAHNFITLLDGTQWSRDATGPVWTFYTGQPDLTVKNLAITPGVVSTDKKFTIAFDETNLGASVAHMHMTQVWASPDRYFTRNGNDIALARLWSVTPGNSTVRQTVTLDPAAVGWNDWDAKTQPLRPGTYYIGIFSDVYNLEPTECVETNNTLIDLNQRLVVLKSNGARDWSLYR